MRLSKHSIVTPSGSHVFVTGLLERAVVKVPTEDWDLLVRQKFDPGECLNTSDGALIQQLKDSKIIVDDDFNELRYIVERSAASRAVSDTFGLVIVPSMSCNMNCHYCFEDKSDRSELSNINSDALAELAKSELEDSRVSNLYVRWFGGEPLNNPKLLQAVMKKLTDVTNKIGKRIGGDIVTNGYDLTGDLAQELSLMGLNSAQITFEGKKRQHDRIRRVGHLGSYDRLLENILAASEFMQIRIRIHVAPYNLPGIAEMLKDFSEKGLQQAIAYIYFAPLFNYKQSSKDTAFHDNSKLFLSSQDFAEKAVGLTNIARELGFTLADPLDAHYSVCTALREYTAVVNPDGSLSKCYMDAGDRSEAYGSLTDGIFAEDNLRKWRQINFADDDECRDCTFSPICLGGCAKESMNRADKSVICTPLRYNIDELIPIHYG